MTVRSLALTKAGLISALSTPADAADPSAGTDEARRRLASAIETHGNDDALARRVALCAITAGRAAFWTTARYHSQKACILQIAIHAQSSIEAALDYAYSPGEAADFGIEALDTLVPLNHLAAEALALAYARLDATCDLDALLARCERHTPRPARNQELGEE